MAARDAGVDMRSYRRLMDALATADRETKRQSLRAIRAAVEPVRVDAENLAVHRITNIGRAWSRMRTRVIRQGASVTVRERGVRSRFEQQLKRPNLARLLTRRSLGPALARNRRRVLKAVDRELDRVARKFNRTR